MAKLAYQCLIWFDTDTLGECNGSEVEKLDEAMEKSDKAKTKTDQKKKNTTLTGRKGKKINKSSAAKAMALKKTLLKIKAPQAIVSHGLGRLVCKTCVASGAMYDP